jgi:uncharacterized protein (TIGR00369 family)
MSALLQLGKEMFDRAMGDERQEFGSFFLSRLLGFTVSYDAEACMVSFDASPLLRNPQGSLHGGVLATALDIAMGHLLNHVAGPGATIEMKTQYMAPVLTGRVICRATFLKRGHKLSFLQAQAIDQDGKIVAHSTATWKQILMRKD